MGSSLKSQDQQIDAMNADSSVSLISSPSTATPDQNNDEAMDLFLNQVAEFTNHHHHFGLTSDSTGSNLLDTHTLLQHEQSELDPQNLADLTMENHQDLMGLSPTTVGQSEAGTDIMDPPVHSLDNAKGKGKETSGNGSSSLLNVFANPLLHAIPVLARNCLNFEDFLAQAALHGQNGLLGPKKADDYAAPDKLMLDPSKDSFMTGKIGSPWHVRVLGLPPSGAKSRVETQIKVCIQLVNNSNELATNFTHLRLPEHMVAKEKLKRKHQKSDDRSALVESKVLKLEAAVVCDSHPDNEIIMCASCVHRERKRLKRKRDNKVARAANKEGNAAKIAALYANDLPDLDDEEVMAQERRKILLFNCSEYIEFNDGEATLPTRVTCYCRHHSEKTGFRIVFTIKDSQNHVLATGRSPPIMITDDHKSSKIQTAVATAAAIAPATVAAPSSTATARKRTRSEYDIEIPAGANKKKTHNEGETDSGVSSPSPAMSTPPTPSSQADDVPTSPEHQKQQNELASVVTSHCDISAAPTSVLNAASAPSDAGSISSASASLNTASSQNFLSHVQSYNPSSNSIQHIPQGELFDFLNSEEINMAHLLPPDQQHTSTRPIPVSTTNPSISSCQSSLQAAALPPPPPPMPLPAHRRRTPLSCAQQQWQASDMYAKMQQKNAMLEHSKGGNPPKLHRLIPSEGPIYGGAEVTVLGANFYEGLTCMFGENPAMPTHCWSPNTLLCILPPAASAGPVVVSFKEHPLMLEGQDVVLFTYFDESDRALMELALQVVGLKTMGKVEDARQIAMRIVQGDSGNYRKDGNINNSGSNGTIQSSAPSPRIEYREVMTTKAAMAVYDNARALFISRLEEQVISALISAEASEYHGELSLTNRNQHSLLHLATLCGYDQLVRALVKLGCDVNQPDYNGFTALHFASWTGKVDIVQVLIAKANLQARNIMGKTPEKMALEAGHAQVVELFRKMPRRKKKRSRHQQSQDVRIPLSDFIPSEAVETARAVLPARLTCMLSSFYTFSINTSCVKNLGVAVGQVYNFMLDPF